MTKPLQLTNVTRSATTYSLREVGGSAWVLATVNDGTGGLDISSSYGAWSYRWNTAGLGSRLTEFLAGSDVDYLARKLLAGEQGRQFSPRATITAIRRKLCERRLADGREALAERIDDPQELRWLTQCGVQYDEDGFPVLAGRHTARSERLGSPQVQHPELLTKDKARNIWKQIIRFDGYFDERIFVEEYAKWVFRGDLDDYIPHPEDTEFFECVTYEPSAEWAWLTERILPAIITAIRQDMEKHARAGAQQ